LGRIISFVLDFGNSQWCEIGNPKQYQNFNVQNSKQTTAAAVAFPF
jgi:hypothetical protein